MPHYLLSIVQPDAAPDPVVLERVMADLRVFDEQLRASGSWVFTGGLEPPHHATVIRPDGLATDGPYVEAKEHLGGLWIITAPDLAAAREWGRRAAAATTLPIEVRAFQGPGEPTP